jgi:ribosomal protein S18 acetylase RimI-like enzyme
MDFIVRSKEQQDTGRIDKFLKEQWGSSMIVVHGDVYHPAVLDGFVAVACDDIVGLITYTIKEGSCEIVTLNSTQPQHGIGTALIRAVENRARQSDCRRVWLTTTNDNLRALCFYQRRGYFLAALRSNAVTAARVVKPEIPATGANGLPLRDEIDLEKMLA